MVFFMLNQCRILYFTINIKINSVHVTGCIGDEEIPKKTYKMFGREVVSSLPYRILDEMNKNEDTEFRLLT
jgi:hypothetical protein